MALIIIALVMLISGYNTTNKYGINQVNKLDEILEKWIDADIDYYEISGRYERWDIKIIVKSEKVIESTIKCRSSYYYSDYYPDYCDYDIYPNDLPVLGLFNYLSSEYSEPPWKCGNPRYLRGNYSSEYGYPTKIYTDELYCSGETKYIKITSF